MTIDTILEKADLSELREKKNIIAIGKMYEGTLLICIDSSVDNETDKERIKQDLINEVHKNMEKKVHIYYRK